VAAQCMLDLQGLHVGCQQQQHACVSGPHRPALLGVSGLVTECVCMFSCCCASAAALLAVELYACCSEAQYAVTACPHTAADWRSGKGRIIVTLGFCTSPHCTATFHDAILHQPRMPPLCCDMVTSYWLWSTYMGFYGAVL
jgi:hypothetical protein